MLPGSTFKSRKKFLSRNISSIRGAFYKMNFDLATEWIQAYRELTDPKDKIDALGKAFPFIYPKVASLTPEEIATLEMEQELTTIDTESLSTDMLLESLQKEKEVK